MKRKKSVIKITLCCVFALALVPAFCFGAEYPTKPVSLIVTFAPGGTLDVGARLLAAKAEKILGQPIMVSNVGGGGGSVALGQMATKTPDGYNITCCTSSGLVRIPQLRKVPYSTDDFIPIMHFAAVQTGVVVKADSPYKSFKDLVEYAKKNPGVITYATSGASSPMHMSMEYVAEKDGLKWIHVPFTGGPPALAAVLGGHVTAMVDSPEWLPHVQNGTLRLLVSHGEKRMRTFPDVPTLRDLGYDFINDAIFMMAAPKGTPAPIIKKLDDAFRKAMEDPQFVKSMTDFQFEVTYRNSADTKKFLDEASKNIARMIKALGIKQE